MITHIVTHKRPHADELVARMLLRRFKAGELKFPGILSASTSYMTTGELTDGKTWQDFPDTVFLGCGGGPFDEHATTKKERDENESCVTLVAKYLELEGEKGLEKILYYIKKEDLGGSKVKHELPSVIKLLHAKYGSDDEGIARWTEDAYFAIYQDENAKWEAIKNDSDAEEKWDALKKQWQPLTILSTYDVLASQNYHDLSWWKKFADDAIRHQQEQFDAAGREFEENAIASREVGPNGKMINFAVVESDNEEINKYARSKGADIVVQFQGGGRCFITTNQRAGIDLTYAFVLLRMAEQHYRGGITIKDEETLSKEGFVDGVPCWYLFHTRHMGFNGSLTATDVEPSKIPREKVVECIKEGIKRS